LNFVGRDPPLPHLCTGLIYNFIHLNTQHMRTFFQSFLLAFLVTGGFAAAQAQPGGMGMGMDPEKRAEQQTATMTEKLSLSEAQTAKVREINLKYANKMKEARDKADGDREAMRATMTTLRSEQDKELQTVLTEEQWQQWLKIREEMKNNRPGWGGKPKDGKKDESPGKGQ